MEPTRKHGVEDKARYALARKNHVETEAARDSKKFTSK